MAFCLFLSLFLATNTGIPLLANGASGVSVGPVTVVASILDANVGDTKDQANRVASSVAFFVK